MFRFFFSMAEGGCEKFQTIGTQNSFGLSLRNTFPMDIQWTFLSKVGYDHTSLFLSLFVFIIIFEFLSLNFLISQFLFFRIFLSYKSRKLVLESELSINPNLSDSCRCAPVTDLSRASDPTGEFVRRWEVFKFLWLVFQCYFILLSIFFICLLLPWCFVYLIF